ncbi:MAG: recombinase family protein [Anaerolineales bacterium]|nr:recombinase family protein [Anaerolineales bacterium]
MSKRAAIYARVSTDMQRDNFSIPSQIGECVKFASSKRYSLVGNQFVDSETGRDVAEDFPNAIPAFADDFTSRELSRPSLDAALYFLEKFGFDILIVHALDRLARDPYIRQTLEREFNNRGARVEYVLGAYEETPEGEIRKDLDATFAKWENAKRVERSQRGKRAKAASGKWVSGIAPFGYQLVPEAKGGLVIDPEQADDVRKIFHLYTEEKRSIREIARIMSEEGHISRRGNSEWAKTSINRILVNTTYIGYCYFNRTKRMGNGRAEKDREDWIRIGCDAIVDLATFEKAQKRMKHNKAYVRKHPARTYLLSGMVFCSECERPYLSQTAKANRNRRKVDAQSYRHRVRAGHCMNKQISARVLEPIVWEQVLEILLNPAALLEGYKRSLEAQQASQARKLAQIQTLEKALHKVKMVRQNLNSAYLDPDIEMSKSEYMDQKVHLDEETQTIENDLLELRADITDIPEPASVDALEKFADEILEELFAEEEITLTMQRQLFEMMHLQVKLHPNGDVKIDGWFNVPENDGLSSRPSKHYARQRRRLRGRA